jgi:hypothetical protein
LETCTSSGCAGTPTCASVASRFSKQTQRLPDFTLSGKIIETIDRSGDTSRHTYTFQLSLNDTKTGYQVWQGEKEIGKQGTRSTIGF